MNLGIALPILKNIDIEDQLEIAIRAEELGFGSVWASDHVIIPQEWEGRFADIFPDPFVMLTAISQNTSKITLGTSAIILPYRNPLIVAKMLSTLDCLCNGRLICTVAAGWMEEEFKILNAPYNERADRTSEYIKIIKTLWETNPSSFHGKYYSFKNVSFRPKPKQKNFPIYMGGSSDQAIDRALELVDGWQPIWLNPDELKDKISYLKNSAEQKGVDTVNYDISLRNRIQLTTDNNSDNPSTVLIGSKDKVFRAILSYKKLDIKEVVLDFITPDKDEILKTMATLSNELMPKL